AFLGRTGTGSLDENGITSSSIWVVRLLPPPSSLSRSGDHALSCVAPRSEDGCSPMGGRALAKGTATSPRPSPPARQPLHGHCRPCRDRAAAATLKPASGPILKVGSNPAPSAEIPCGAPAVRLRRLPAQSHRAPPNLAVTRCSGAYRGRGDL